VAETSACETTSAYAPSRSTHPRSTSAPRATACSVRDDEAAASTWHSYAPVHGTCDRRRRSVRTSAPLHRPGNGLKVNVQFVGVGAAAPYFAAR